MTIEPRWYQKEAIDAIYNYFMSNNGNPLIGLPTASGKSLIPALFIKMTMKYWPNQRFLLITTVKELIQQNYEVLKYVWPNCPVGIFSAGLKKRDFALPVIYGGLQSMIKCPMKFGFRDIIFIDEVHLVSDDEKSMYQMFLSTMKLINPNVKIIGLSAVLFRMGLGKLTENGIFTDVIYDMTDINGFNKLLEDGYLCPLIPLRTKTEIDISEVSIYKGEFIQNQLQSVIDKHEITYKALRETVEAGRNRKCWLIFASGIEHSNHIAEMLRTFGIECASIHSKQTSQYNDGAIKAWKEGSLKVVSNYGKLTTGINNPQIDLISMLRPTLSVPLWVQMLGRAMRPYKGKENALILDFAGNTLRLGPINDVMLPKKKGDKQGDVPVKICDSCGAYNHTRVRFCCQCKNEFEFQIKIVAKSGKEELLRSDVPIIETFDVTQAIYAKKHKLDKNTKAIIGKPYIRCNYFCGMQSFSQNIFPEHGGYSRKLFTDWWKQRHPNDPPETTDEALQCIPNLRCPKKIRVWVNKKFPDIVSCEF